MPRGGKRIGSGRKAQGITKKVSFTLSQEEWNQIEESGLTPAAFLQQLMHAPAQNNEKPKEDTNYTKARIAERWDTYIKYISKESHSPEAVEEAKKAMYRLLFPGNTEYAKVETKKQYICPCTGKKFGSMATLVDSVIPWLLKSCAAEIERNKQLRILNEIKKKERIEAEQRNERLAAIYRERHGKK